MVFLSLAGPFLKEAGAWLISRHSAGVIPLVIYCDPPLVSNLLIQSDVFGIGNLDLLVNSVLASGQLNLGFGTKRFQCLLTCRIIASALTFSFVWLLESCILGPFHYVLAFSVAPETLSGSYPFCTWSVRNVLWSLMSNVHCLLL